MGASLVAVAAACACALSGLPACAAESGARSSFVSAEWNSKGEWLDEGSVLMIRDFVSKREARSLKATAEKLFAVDNGPRWREAVYNTAFLQGPHARELLTDEVMELERRIENITGISMHRDEALMMFTRHQPGAMPPGHFVRNVHHDKNTAERRTVTALVYLTSAKSDAEGGHTLFPTLPRLPEADQAVGGTEDDDPIPYLKDALAGAFRAGRRVLDNGELLGQHGEVWDDKALRLVQQECALALKGRSHVQAVRPRRGTALVFWHVRPDGTPNPLAWHAACHAAKGAPRFTAQKFKEPLMGNALEDQTLEPEPGARSDL